MEKIIQEGDTMIVIRKNVFETNSSSSHSLSIKRNRSGKYDYNIPLQKNGNCPIIFGRDYDFGWGDAVYCDTYAKLNYLACMAFECHNHLMYKIGREPLSNLDDVLKIKDMKKLSSVLKKNIKGFTGLVINSVDFSRYRMSPQSLYLLESIDHQSWEDYKNIDEFLKKYNISLENFLFNPAVKLIIGNDNCDNYDYF